MSVTRDLHSLIQLPANDAWQSQLVSLGSLRHIINLTLNAAVLVGTAQQWLPELVERAKKLKVNQGFEAGADL